MANIYRDVTLQNVSENDIGKQMKVSGWVENIRDHGGVSFIDLRDMYGVLQVVIREPELLKGIKKEECISIDGIMEQRDEETYNPKIPSGTIELEAKKITVLGQVYQQVPFEIQTPCAARCAAFSTKWRGLWASSAASGSPGAIMASWAASFPSIRRPNGSTSSPMC